MTYSTISEYTSTRTRPVVLHKNFASLGQFDERYSMSVPGMITKAERLALYQLGRLYSGKGKIVDAGCFLGASTTALAAGIQSNDTRNAENREPIIHSYDIGVLPKPANAKAPTTKQYDGFNYVFGESFVPELKNNIVDYAPLIELHIGDIVEQQWFDGPIEICFLDICKRIAIDTHVARIYFCNFIANTTLLVQQDYFFHRLPWIKITLGLLADHFEWLGRVESSSIYRCRSVPSVDDIPENVFRDYELESLIKLHRFAYPDLLDDRTRLQLDVSEMYLLALKKDEKRALQGLVDIADSYRDTIAAWDSEISPPSDQSYTAHGAGEATRVLAQAERLIRIGHVHRVSW